MPLSLILLETTMTKRMLSQLLLSVLPACGGDGATEPAANPEFDTVKNAAGGSSPTLDDEQVQSRGGANANSGSGGEGGNDELGTGGSASAPSGSPFVFVGTTEGMILAFRMSELDGKLTDAGSYDAGELNFLALGPEKSGVVTLFVTAPDLVSSLEYDAKDGSFQLLDTAVTSGRGTHVAQASAGSSVLIAHYGQNSVSYFDYDASTGFSSESVFFPGEKAHQVRVRDNDIYVPCLGSDLVAHYKIGSGLAASSPPSFAATGGPRHMDFHPSAPLAFVLTELTSQVRVYDLDASGSASERTGAAFTHSDGQGHKSSDIKVSPDGKFLYAVNREPSELVTFQVGANYELSRKESIALTGEVRSFGMDPKGAFLQVGSKAGVLHTFAVAPLTGALSRADSISSLGTINVTEVAYLTE